MLNVECRMIRPVANGMERPAKRERNEVSLSEAPKFGAEDWNRTSDTSIFSAVLYQLSYLGTRRPRLAEPSSYHHWIVKAARVSTRARASPPVVDASLAPVHEIDAAVGRVIELKARRRAHLLDVHGRLH